MDKKTESKNQLPEGVTLEKLKRNWDIATTVYQPVFERMRLLDGADRGKLWEVIGAKMPSYQLLPETNHISEVKTNLVASLYSVGKEAYITPRRGEDTKIVAELNSILRNIWDTAEVEYYQLRAGERAACLNLGITQVGWSTDLIGGTQHSLYKGDVSLKNINPMHFMKDPGADEIDDGAYCIYWDSFHKSTIMANKKYKEAFKAYKQDTTMSATANPVESAGIKNDSNRQPDDGYHKIIIHWVKVNDDSKEGYSIHEVHTIDNSYVLYVKEDIQPKAYPFAELYCELAVDDPVGVGPTAKIFKNSVIYNLISSIQATQVYKAQRPSKFISQAAGLNVRSFAKYGNDPDKAFIVQGDASKAVHYQAIDPLPVEAQQLKIDLFGDMQRVSGVDDRYKGRDTGSITTTGGIEDMITRVTMIDAPKIKNAEKYAKRLTKLIMENHILYADTRSYSTTNEATGEVVQKTIDFPKIPDEIRFNYGIDISNILPRNKARLAQAANMLMEKQAQYQPTPEIITIEEWLMFQDLPFKDLIETRMGIQRTNNMAEQVTETLYQFSDLVGKGVDPTEAVALTAETLRDRQDPRKLGNVGQQNMNNFQNRQEG